MATRAVPTPLAQLPNALTLGRLVVIPVFVALMIRAGAGHSWPAAILFGAAGVTDQVDGFLARRWHVESRFGKIADPLADRLLIDAAVIILVAYGRLPWVGLVVIGARDLLLLARLARTRPARRRPRRQRARQGRDVGALRGIGFRLGFEDNTTWPLWLFWIGLGTSVLAAMFYVRDAWKELQR